VCQRSEAYPLGMLLFPFRVIWVLMVGVPIALCLFALAMLAGVTIIGLPLAAVLAVLAIRALSAPF
jgi:uncharacterized membrane protein YccF (DUF307 family)